MSDKTLLLLQMACTISIFLIIFLIIRAIWRAIKRFTFEIIDRTNGTTPRKPDYQSETQRACKKVTPKKSKDTTPPWKG